MAGRAAGGTWPVNKHVSQVPFPSWAVGNVKTGNFADFILIDLADIALVPVDKLESHMVYSMSDRALRHVCIHGRGVVRDGRVTGLDERDLTRRVHAATRAFFRA
jgi:cytosine/adenosine deaminase-related metal-dependent hydrolase